MFFLTVGQDNFGNKIPFARNRNMCRSYIYNNYRIFSILKSVSLSFNIATYPNQAVKKSNFIAYPELCTLKKAIV